MGFSGVWRYCDWEIPRQNVSESSRFSVSLVFQVNESHISFTTLLGAKDIINYSFSFENPDTNSQKETLNPTTKFPEQLPRLQPIARAECVLHGR
jgi:hypothetical protein